MPTEPEKQRVVLANRCSPGDVLMLTAAVRDLHRAHADRFQISVDTCCPDLWLGNPYVTPLPAPTAGAIRIECHHPPMLDRCNSQPGHYIQSIHDLLAQRLGCPVPIGRFAPDLHLSETEKLNPPLGLSKPYWVMMAGGKRDLTTKWWPSAWYQEVVDHFQGRITFVQAGAGSDHHPPLDKVINVVGRTRLRDLVSLIYHSDGVVCPVTSGMHLAAAFDKPCVVIAAGREPPHWEMYPGHQFLHTIGQLPCCRTGGCWKARVVPLGDGDRDRDQNLCLLPTETAGAPVAACMTLVTVADVCRAVERFQVNPRIIPMALTDANARAVVEQRVSQLPPYPGGHEGRGIVIPGGGHRYFPSAWVCIQMLRRAGCALPIELWHLGPQEMDDDMRALVAPFGVTCVDALEVSRTHPVRRLAGWELKPYAIMHSRFQEVLMLDADNMPVADPTYLFDTTPYREHGAIFWPDYSRLGPGRDIWRLTGVPYRDEAEFESGQVVVDKKRCWDALCLTLWMNEHSDFWYRHIYGDKDTFHFSWRIVGRDYAMPSRHIHTLWGVMCQHDFDGKRIFQHRNMHKWRMDRANPRVQGFQWESECHDAMKLLHKLWRHWPGKPFSEKEADEELRAQALELCSRRWNYRRLDRDERIIALAINGRVQEGVADCERTWNLIRQGDASVLMLGGKDGNTARLTRSGDKWSGRWLIHERMPVELIPREEPPAQPFNAAGATKTLRDAAARLVAVRWVYRRAGWDERRLRLSMDGLIAEGEADLEQAWSLRESERGIELLIFGRDGLTCALTEKHDQGWVGRWMIHEGMPVELVDPANPAVNLRYDDRAASPDARAAARSLCGRGWSFRRVGSDSRSLEFGLDGSLRHGGDDQQELWDLHWDEGGVWTLDLAGVAGRVCTLKQVGGDRWAGRYDVGDRALVEMVTGRGVRRTLSDKERDAMKRISRNPWRYVRVGFDERTIQLSCDGGIVAGKARMETDWTVFDTGGNLELWILGREGVTCTLVDAGNRWVGKWMIHERMDVVLEPVLEGPRVEKEAPAENAPLAKAEPFEKVAP